MVVVVVRLSYNYRGVGRGKGVRGAGGWEGLPCVLLPLIEKALLRSLHDLLERG